MDVLVAVDVVVVVVDELVVVVELVEDVEVEVVVDSVEVDVELVAEDVVVDSVEDVDDSEVVVVLSAVVSEVEVVDSELSVVSRARIQASTELSRISKTLLVSSEGGDSMALAIFAACGASDIDEGVYGWQEACRNCPARHKCSRFRMSVIGAK